MEREQITFLYGKACELGMSVLERTEFGKPKYKF